MQQAYFVRRGGSSTCSSRLCQRLVSDMYCWGLRLVVFCISLQMLKLGFVVSPVSTVTTVSTM